jgi:hypothetical protein
LFNILAVVVQNEYQQNVVIQVQTAIQQEQSTSVVPNHPVGQQPPESAELTSSQQQFCSNTNWK